MPKFLDLEPVTREFQDVATQNDGRENGSAVFITAPSVRIGSEQRNRGEADQPALEIHIKNELVEK
jgi:hypothetical protein